jgi:hypothetical protein
MEVLAAAGNHYFSLSSLKLKFKKNEKNEESITATA